MVKVTAEKEKKVAKAIKRIKKLANGKWHTDDDTYDVFLDHAVEASDAYLCEDFQDVSATRDINLIDAANMCLLKWNMPIVVTDVRVRDASMAVLEWKFEERK